MIVHLLNQVLDIRVGHLELFTLHGVLQFTSLNHACSIYVNGLEHGTKISNFLLSGSLDQKVHCRLLKLGNSLELLKSLNHIVTDGVHSQFLIPLLNGGLVKAELSKPRMLQSLLSCQAFLDIDNEELLDEIFAII